MSNNNFQLYVTIPSDEGIEPEIARKMTIPKMEVPEDSEFEKYIPASISKQPKETQVILTIVSPLGGKVDFMTRWIQRINYDMRQSEAEKIRRNRLVPKALTACAYMLFTGIAFALGEAIIHFLHLP